MHRRLTGVWRWGIWGGSVLRVPSPTLPSRLQELYYEIVNVLNLMLEDLPQQKSSRSSELMI